MLKLLGALLILGVGSLSAFLTARYERRRLSVLDGWLDLILYIRAQIDCYLRPLGEILSTRDAAHLDETLAAPDADLPAILEASSLYLDGDTNHLLEGFVREIGGGYREEQLKHCDYYISALRDHRTRVAAELPSRIRLTVALCICAALGTAILLW